MTMSRRSRRARWMHGVLVALGAWTLCAALFPGCAPDDAPFFYREDFEDLCEGTPCGWLQVRGAEGGVSLGETLPGDRALVFTGDGVVARGEGRLPPFSANIEDLVLSSVARCDGGSTLRAEFTFLRLGTDTIETRARDLGAFQDFENGPLPARFETGPLGLTSVSEVAALLLFKSGTGTCELASITLEQVGAFAFR